MKIDDLTPEQKRIAVLKAWGWKVTHDANAPKNVCPFQLFRPGGGREGYAFEERTLWIHYAPDPLTDLNACHEFEKTLTDEQFDDYKGCLLDLAAGPAYHHWSDAWVWREFVSAPPQNRCDALLLTLP